MSTYLTIAELVLKKAKRPLSARSILKKAYDAGLVPDQLYGKTQDKTLQARLSEDILHRRDHSPFFRTRPGTFFLRQFLTDPTLPVEFRREMTARRRTRELLRGPALAVDGEALTRLLGDSNCWAAEHALSTISGEGIYSYIDPKRADRKYPLLWAVSAVMKDRKVLCYRVGRYRDDRDSFVHKRTIGFAALVLEEDRNLFDASGFGIADSGLAAVATDLDIPISMSSNARDGFGHSVKFLAWCHDAARSDLLAFIEVRAPSWFEPSTSRLSLNDLDWLDLDVPPNNLDDFDPWSRTLLSCFFDPVRLHG